MLVLEKLLSQNEASLSLFFTEWSSIPSFPAQSLILPNLGLLSFSDHIHDHGWEMFSESTQLCLLLIFVTPAEVTAALLLWPYTSLTSPQLHCLMFCSSSRNTCSLLLCSVAPGSGPGQLYHLQCFTFSAFSSLKNSQGKIHWGDFGLFCCVSGEVTPLGFFLASWDFM